MHPKKSPYSLVYQSLHQILKSLSPDLIWVILKRYVDDLKLLQVAFELLANVHVVFASSPLVALNHDVVFPQNLNVLKEVMVQVVNLMVHILLEEVYELVRVPHYLGFAPVLGAFRPRPLEGGSLNLTLFIVHVGDLLVKSCVDGVREHEPLDLLALLGIEFIGAHDRAKKLLSVCIHEVEFVFYYLERFATQRSEFTLSNSLENMFLNKFRVYLALLFNYLVRWHTKNIPVSVLSEDVEVVNEVCLNLLGEN